MKNKKIRDMNDNKLKDVLPTNFCFLINDEQRHMYVYSKETTIADAKNLITL